MEPRVLVGEGTMNAPWGLDYTLDIVVLACNFFDVTNLEDSHASIGKEVTGGGNPTPLTGEDFLKYLDVRNTYAKTPNALRVGQILRRMTSIGLLEPAGRGKYGIAGLSDHYLHANFEYQARRHSFRMVSMLGPELLYRLCKPGLVHITGTDQKGQDIAGTGLVVDQSHVLTCRHVVSDMDVKPKQKFQGKDFTVSEDKIYKHGEVDLAVIQVDRPELNPLQGVVFQTPVVAEIVYALGYPKLPFLRDASVVIQSGAVTNEFLSVNS